MKEHNRKVFQRRKKTIVQLLVFAQRETDLGEILSPLTSPLHNTIIYSLHHALYTYSIQLFHHCKNKLSLLCVLLRMQLYVPLHKG